MSYLLKKLSSDTYYNAVHFLDGNNLAVPAPKYVLWDCTRRCNLSCIHCGATNRVYSTELSPEQIFNLIDDMTQMGVRFFACTGGEPFLRPDLIEIFEYAHKTMETGVATNGTLIKDYPKVLDTFDSIQISIDGSRVVHNMIRKNDRAYDLAMASVHKLCEKTTVCTVVQKANVHHLTEIYESIRSLVPTWKLVFPMPIGRAIFNNVALTPKETESALTFLKTIKDIRIRIGENYPDLGKFECIRKEPEKCMVGLQACCIGVDGHIRGCPEQPDIPAFQEGYALKKPFSEIWQKGFKRYRIEDCRNKCSVMSLTQERNDKIIG